MDLYVTRGKVVDPEGELLFGIVSGYFVASADHQTWSGVIRIEDDAAPSLFERCLYVESATGLSAHMRGIEVDIPYPYIKEIKVVSVDEPPWWV